VYCDLYLVSVLTFFISLFLNIISVMLMQYLPLSHISTKLKYNFSVCYSICFCTTLLTWYFTDIVVIRGKDWIGCSCSCLRFC
jgi:hypothetical protein